MPLQQRSHLAHVRLQIPSEPLSISIDSHFSFQSLYPVNSIVTALMLLSPFDDYNPLSQVYLKLDRNAT